MDTRRLRTAAGALAVLLICVTASCAADDPPGAAVDDQPSASTAASPSAEVAGLVELPSGREIYVECRGTGAPTVVFISGGGLAADAWSTLAPDSTEVPVMDAIGETNRVCAYDRPGTTRVTGEASRSDPVELPRTLSDMAVELRDLLRVTGEEGPVVLVGHSFGSPIGRLFAGMNPDAVAGMVWVDGGHETFYEVFEEVVGPAGYDVPGVEYSLPPTLIDMREQFAAHPLPPVPTAVIEHSQDEKRVPNPMGWDPAWPIDQLEVAWQEAQTDLAGLVPGTTRIVAEDSGHLIMVEQAQLVVDAIRAVLDAVPGR